MELKKDKWTKNDIKEFQEYLKTFERSEKREWSVNLLKTELPVLCLTTLEMKKIINEIVKGSYIEFLDLMIWEYYENTVINGSLIPKIKDFDTMKKYLDIYSSKADNWATCDLLKFNIKDKEKQYFDLSLEYMKSDKPFVRRIGIYILFYFLDDDKYIDKIFKLLDNFSDEKHYYVNMMLAWILSECFIKQREKTLEYLNVTKLNKFAKNKGIQKCRESRRVTIEDKDMLLQYKIK